MNKTLYLLRAVSGAGKTTLANTLVEHLPNTVAFAADDYHYDDKGVYNWKPENMSKAHKWCQDSVRKSMEQPCSNIVVHNTNTSEKEIAPYLSLAKEYGYKVVSLLIENRHGNKSVHGVPEKVLEAQEQRLRNSLKLS
ncbi:MAG: ATP-binding protein [bacterium]|nr:ATP-binding protein [bacterium]